MITRTNTTILDRNRQKADIRNLWCIAHQIGSIKEEMTARLSLCLSRPCHFPPLVLPLFPRRIYTHTDYHSLGKFLFFRSLTVSFLLLLWRVSDSYRLVVVVVVSCLIRWKKTAARQTGESKASLLPCRQSNQGQWLWQPHPLIYFQWCQSPALNRRWLVRQLRFVSTMYLAEWNE